MRDEKGFYNIRFAIEETIRARNKHEEPTQKAGETLTGRSELPLYNFYPSTFTEGLDRAQGEAEREVGALIVDYLNAYKGRLLAIKYDFEWHYIDGPPASVCITCSAEIQGGL